MARLTKKQIENRLAIAADNSRPLESRKKAYQEVMNNVLNPEENFNPETFDPKKGTVGYEAKRRIREKPPRRLPRPAGLQAKKILEGQMVGMFESKQDLYLLIADLYDRVSDIEDHLGINQ